MSKRENRQVCKQKQKKIETKALEIWSFEGLESPTDS